MRHRGAGQVKRGVDAYADHAGPDLRRCFLQAREDDEPGIVDQAVHPSELRKGELDDTPAGCGILQVLVTGSRGATTCRNLRDDAVCDCRVEATAVWCHAGIVHDDRAAQRRYEPRVGRAQPTSRPRDDDDLSVEANLAHCYASSPANAAATNRGSVNMG